MIKMGKEQLQSELTKYAILGIAGYFVYKAIKKWWDENASNWQEEAEDALEDAGQVVVDFVEDVDGYITDVVNDYIIDPANEYVIDPINTNVIEPTNENIINPINDGINTIDFLDVVDEDPIPEIEPIEEIGEYLGIIPDNNEQIDHIMGENGEVSMRYWERYTDDEKYFMTYQYYRNIKDYSRSKSRYKADHADERSNYRKRKILEYFRAKWIQWPRHEENWLLIKDVEAKIREANHPNGIPPYPDFYNISIEWKPMSVNGEQLYNPTPTYQGGHGWHGNRDLPKYLQS